LHVVCERLGNSEDIARKHYYQVTDDHFSEATASLDKSGAESSEARARSEWRRLAHLGATR